MKKDFLLMLEYFEEGKFTELIIIYDGLDSNTQIQLCTDCFEKNIFSINASTRIKIMSFLLKTIICA